MFIFSKQEERNYFTNNIGFMWAPMVDFIVSEPSAFMCRAYRDDKLCILCDFIV